MIRKPTVARTVVDTKHSLSKPTIMGRKKKKRKKKVVERKRVRRKAKGV